MQNEVNIRDLQTVEELERVRELEALIWSAEDSVPVNQTVAAVKNGGFVLGAFLKEKLIGFQYSFAGFDGEKVYLCSHSLGIHPEYRRFGVGEKLKWAQKKLAIQKGYTLITWTYDPLETVNANLNLHKLRSTCSRYLENVYGEMNDELNAGIPSDRFFVEWSVGTVKEKEEIKGEGAFVIDTVTLNGYLVPEKINVDVKDKVLFVRVPSNFQEIKKNDIALARRWREATRAIFKTYFQSGYIATDLVKEKDLHYYYVLQKGNE